jgi:hypothetical protein
VSYERIEAPKRPPVALGCTLLAGGAALVAAFAVVLVIFLDSGAEGSRLILREAEAYRPGSVEFVTGRDLYLVRMGDGTFYALSNLSPPVPGEQRPCRVQPASSTTPAIAGALEAAGVQASPASAGSTFFFIDECRGTLFDVTGVRMETTGRNLARYPTAVGSDGRLAVQLDRRTCTLREPGRLDVPVDC